MVKFFVNPYEYFSQRSYGGKKGGLYDYTSRWFLVAVDMRLKLSIVGLIIETS